MASSGTITGSRSGTQPYLRMQWEILSQDIPNNRSRVRLRLILVSEFNLFFSASKTGSNNGSSFTYTGGFSGTGTRVLNTREIWVNHNSDGTRNQSVSASFNIQVTWSGSQLNTISLSGTMNLDTIPRASSINSFSIANSLRPSTSNTVNLSLTRHSSSFTHNISLRIGSTTIASWNGQGNPSSLSLSSSQVNSLLSRMSTTTSATVTLRVQTRSGSTNIGSVVTRNTTASVSSTVVPNASNLSYSINGNGHDSSIDKFVQNISRVTASFSASAVGGASLSSTNIVVRRNSDNANSMTINGTSGTTGTVTRNGTYEIIATARDSRGRTATQRRTFTVHAYSSPNITDFSASRNEGTPTTVSIRRFGNHSNLGGDNRLTITVERRQGVGSGSWSTVNSTNTTSSSFGTTLTSTGNAVTSSYEFRLIVTDQFNRSMEATATVSTQQVVLDIHKDLGVGIGKIHEDGSLDVGGDAYFRDTVHLEGGIRPQRVLPDTDFDDYRQTGFYFNPANAETQTIANRPTNNAFSMLVEGHAGVKQTYTSYHRNNLVTMFMRNFYAGSWGNWNEFPLILMQGSNSNGEFIRFSNGLQICWQTDIRITFNNSELIGGSWAFPVSFSSSSNTVVMGIKSGATGDYNRRQVRDNSGNVDALSVISTSVQLRLRQIPGQVFASGDWANILGVMAIGSWK